MRARSVNSEASPAPITKQEATVDYAGTRYVIVGVHDTPYDGQWGLWAMRPAGRKVHMGTLFGFDDHGRPRIWISRGGLPARRNDRPAGDATWSEPKREAAARMIELQWAAKRAHELRVQARSNRVFADQGRRDSHTTVESIRVYDETADDCDRLAAELEAGHNPWTPREAK